MEILTLKISGGGYLINGETHVQDPESPFYKIAQEQIAAGMVPEPEFTDAELAAENMANRAAAYRNESDPLKLEAEYDAMVAGGAPDYTAWLSKVAEIKARYPKP